MGVGAAYQHDYVRRFGEDAFRRPMRKPEPRNREQFFSTTSDLSQAGTQQYEQFSTTSSGVAVVCPKNGH